MQKEVRAIPGLDHKEASSIAHHMICYTKGHFVIGSSKKIFYFKVKDILDEYNHPDAYGREFDLQVGEDKLKYFTVGQNFEFKGFIDVGTGNVAMLMED